MNNFIEKLKKYKKVEWLAATIFLVSALIAIPKTVQPLISNNGPVAIGASGDSSAKWVMIDKFAGYQTKADPQKIDPGANPVGQNTFINDGDRISVRDFGYTIFPATATESTTGTPMTSLHTFRKRDGTNIIIGSYDDKLEYYSNDVGQWEILKTGFTSGKTFGFADQNTNTDQTAYVYFGNAVENYQRWTGNVAVLSQAVAVGDVTLQTNTDITSFPSTGTLILCNNTTTYSAKTLVAPFTFTIPSSTFTCGLSHGIAQIPQEFASAPKGNILMVMNTRMFVAGVASSTQTLFYSKIADATDFTYTAHAATTTSGVPYVVDRLATDGGVINMPEGGGGIVGISQDQGVVYAFKRSIVKSVTFSQDGNDLPTILPLKPFDDKSQTVGAVSSRSIFAGQNGIFFITPNNEIMYLSMLSNISYPQVVPISDIIKPTANALDFSTARGVFWKNKAYFAVKQNTDSIQNDTILVYNEQRKAWESPIIGINVGEWTIANFNNVENLYFGSAFGPNVYQTNQTPLDNGLAITANWRSREETFGTPYALKSMDNFYVEGYITENTTLSISLLFDENGFTQTYTTNFTGSELNDKYLFNKDVFNVFGLNAFGFERFGSNGPILAKKKFRIYLGGNLRRIPFYSAQVEFASTDENAQWEILQYAFHVMPETQEMRTNLIRNW